MQALVPREPAGSVEELVAGATARTPLGAGGGSGATLERVVIDGESFVLKQLHVDHDATLRGFGDLAARAVRLWTTGLLDAMPPVIDHAVVDAAIHLGRNGWGGALLLRDVGAQLIPDGDDPISLEQHRYLIDHLAEIAARFWGWTDHVDLVPMSVRYSMFNPGWLDAEASRGWPDPAPKLAQEGWQRFAERCRPALLDAVTQLRGDVGPLVAALDDTPSTFLHGDWRMGNLGSHEDRRTVLLDWSYPGVGPVLHDLAWYLSRNSARLPEPKEDAIEALRISLEDRGIETARWWGRQLDLCLLGGLLQLGWEQAFGPDAELDWWCDHAQHGVERL